MTVDPATPTPHTSRGSMFWRTDEAVQKARGLPGWRDFHRVCGKVRLYFDDIEPVKRSGVYRATAFTLKGDCFPYDELRLVEGRGPSPLAAVTEAHDKSGLATDATRAALAILNRTAVIDDGLDELLGPLPRPTLGQLMADEEDLI